MMMGSAKLASTARWSSSGPKPGSSTRATVIGSNPPVDISRHSSAISSTEVAKIGIGSRIQ